MNRLLALSLFVVAASLASCEAISSGGKFMQWDDPGARAGKIALVALYADIEGLDPEDPELAKLESGLLRDVLIAAEDALNEKFDVQPAKNWVADASYRKHATGSTRGVQPMPSLDGQKMVRLTAASDDTLGLHMAGQLADDLGVRYVAVLETALSARMVQVKEVGSISQRGNSPVQMQQRMVFAKTRLTIYKNGFPEVVAEREIQGSPINTQARLVDQFKERRDSTDSLTVGACKSAAGAVESGVKAIMDKIKLTPRGFDYQG